MLVLSFKGSEWRIYYSPFKDSCSGILVSHTPTTKIAILSLGLYNFVMGFGWAYIVGEGGGVGLIRGIKKNVSKQADDKTHFISLQD